MACKAFIVLPPSPGALWMIQGCCGGGMLMVWWTMVVV